MAEMLPSLGPDTGSDNIGMKLAKDPSLLALHPSTTSESLNQPLTVLQSGLSESTPSHVSQTMPFKIPPPWHVKSMPPPPPPTSPHYHPRPTVFTLPEQDAVKKRKRKEDSHDHPNYVSPYKAPSTSMYQPRPKPVSSHFESGSIGTYTGFVEFLEDPNVPITFGGVAPPLPPHRPIIPGWQDFSWKLSNHPPVGTQPLVDSRTKIYAGLDNDPEWHRKYRCGVGESHPLNPGQVPTSNSHSKRSSAQEMVSPKSISNRIQTISAPYASFQTNPISTQAPIAANLPISATTIYPAQSSSVISSKPTAYPQPTTRVAAVRSTSPTPLPRPQVSAADIRRRPSLYKIPAWPNFLEPSSTTLDGRQNQIRNAGSDGSRFLQLNMAQQARAATSHTPNMTPSPFQSPVQPPPKQHGSTPKHSPNL